MLDLTGDYHSVVGDLLHEHDAHHGGTGVSHDSDAITPVAYTELHPSKLDQHSTHAGMIGNSRKTQMALEGILNSPRGTPYDRQWADWLLKRNFGQSETPGFWETP